MEQVVEQMLSDALECIPFVEYSPTGSRLFGGYKDNSDYDYLVLLEHDCDLGDLEDKLSVGNWFDNCLRGDYEGSGTELIMRSKYRGVDLNLIMTTDQKYYNDWISVGELAMRLGLSKEGRKDLYHTAFIERVDGVVGYEKVEEVSV